MMDEFIKIDSDKFTKWLNAVKKVNYNTNKQFSQLLDICMEYENKIDFEKDLLSEIRRINPKMKPSLKKLLND